MRFFSDNTATAAPEILAAIAEANQGHAIAYGDDRVDAAVGCRCWVSISARLCGPSPSPPERPPTR